MLKVVGTGGFLVPYSGYVGVKLEIPTFLDFGEKVLMLVINDSQYSPAVPIQIGTGVINSIVRGIASQDLRQLDDVWRGTSVSVAINLQKVAVSTIGFNLWDVKGPIMTTQEIVLTPQEVRRVHGIMRMKEHQKRIHVIAEPSSKPFLEKVHTTCMYSMLWPRMGKVRVYVQNLGYQAVTIPAKTTIGQIQAANIVPNMLAPL